MCGFRRERKPSKSGDVFETRSQIGAERGIHHSAFENRAAEDRESEPPPQANPGNGQLRFHRGKRR